MSRENLAVPGMSGTGQAKEKRLSLISMDKRATAKFKSSHQENAPSDTFDNSSSAHAHPPVQVKIIENTFRLHPEKSDNLMIFESKIKKIMEEILLNELGDVQYSARSANMLSTSTSNIILDRIKELNIPRYKYACNVLIGQQREQAVHIVSRCVWNTSTDNSISASFENPTLFAVAMLHGIYFD